MKRILARGKKKTVLILLPIIIILLISVLLAGCGSGKEKSKSQKDSSGNSKSKANVDTSKIDACALLAAAKPDELLGTPTEHIAKGDINRDDAKATISYCGYSANNNYLKTISLRIAYVPGSKNPSSASNIYDLGEVKKMGVYTNPETNEVKGVGDVAAYLADDNTYQLKVYWDDGYEMTISLTEINDKAQAQEIAKKVAKVAMNKL